MKSASTVQPSRSSSSRSRSRAGSSMFSRNTARIAMEEGDRRSENTPWCWHRDTWNSAQFSKI